MTTPPSHDLETVRYHPDELSTYHRNPRRGNIEAIAESLQVNGQYRPIAAHHTGRTAYMVELDPAYCDVICRRWQAHTGQTPQRDGDPHPTSF